MIDLRSDTVTRPTKGMIDAMNAAPVGDDVWGDDPSVIALQEAVAERSGKEAALFFPSGTQSNLAALMAHCQRGDEYIVGQDAHTYKYEGGGAAVLGSIQPQPVENAPDGTLPLDKVRAAIKVDDYHFARSKLLALENTMGGKVLPSTYVEEAAQLARDNNLIFHLDGARAWNAAVATNSSLPEICAPFASISLCFSKGMGAPVGSVLVGEPDFIKEARRWRKVLGGGMRQSGYLAAACRYALDHHIDRLAEDHANAARMANALEAVEEVKVVSIATNMLFVRIPAEHCAGLQAHLDQNGILAAIGPVTRFVTHLDISADDVGVIANAVESYFVSAPSQTAAAPIPSQFYGSGL
jgi:threonine aldolase